MAKRAQQQSHDLWIVLIAIFKLAKGISLLLLAVGLLKLLHRDVQTSITHWIEMFRMDPDNQHIHRLLVKVFRVTPKQLKELSAGSFLYAAVFLTEGTGLLLRKHWAEYLTIVSTALFIPLEGYEIYHRITVVRVAVLLINIAIVWYLIVRIKRR